jgi:hypothetical protein
VSATTDKVAGELGSKNDVSPKISRLAEEKKEK